MEVVVAVVMTLKINCWAKDFVAAKLAYLFLVVTV